MMKGEWQAFAVTVSFRDAMMLGDSSSTVFRSSMLTAMLLPDSGWEEISVNGVSLRPGAGDLLHSSPGGFDEEVTVS